jgi:SNF2 family DNA or RNA helicase
MDGFSGAVQTKVLNLAERLLLYIEFIIVERHNPLMNQLRFHPEMVSAAEEQTLMKLARWLLMAESTFRELELMKIELHHAQSYNRVKREYAASLYSLETSALARRPGLALDEDAVLEEPEDSANPEDPEDEASIASWNAQVAELEKSVQSSVSNCVSLKHQLEFALEAGREKIPRLDSFGTKLGLVCQRILDILKEDELVAPPALRNKVLVFSKWSEPLIQLSVFLHENGVQFRFGKDAGVEGRGPHANLAQRLAQFRDDPDVRVLMLNSHSQSTGLTLTQANHVFLLEDLDTAHELQAIGRAHRIGQTRITHIWKCIVYAGELPSFEDPVTAADL